MPKPKVPCLTDFAIVFFGALGDYPPPVIVRASDVRVRDGEVILTDTAGNPVAGFPQGSAYFRVVTDDDRRREARHCLPGCDRLDGHDGRDPGACMRAGAAIEPARGTGPIASALAEKVAGSADPKPPLPKRTTGRRTAK